MFSLQTTAKQCFIIIDNLLKFTIEASVKDLPLFWKLLNHQRLHWAHKIIDSNLTLITILLQLITIDYNLIIKTNLCNELNKEHIFETTNTSIHALLHCYWKNHRFQQIPN
jgi:hypothetical protein